MAARVPDLGAIAAAHPRCAVVDGRVWWLTEEDVSLTYSAARAEVVRHAGGRSEVVGSDIWAVLDAEVRAGSAEDVWVGWFGYSCRTDLPAPTAHGPGGVPDAVWMRPSRSAPWRPGPATVAPSTPAPALPRPAWYSAGFAQVQEALRAGDSYETNLTYRLEVEADPDPVTAFERLCAANPAPYAGFVQHDLPGARGWLVSSSPERYAAVEDGWLETRPIKGTTPRSPDPVEDARNARRLATEPKFLSENLMIIDLLRNDLAMVCVPGTVSVPRLMEVEPYAAVHQLVTTVRGRLRPEVSTLEALRTLFPAGSMTGAPKRRTMEVIARAEDSPRGVYSGAYGRISTNAADLGVIIRSMTSAGDGRWSIGTGGGITVRSDPDEEWAETRWKIAPLLAALGPDGRRCQIRRDALVS